MTTRDTDTTDIETNAFSFLSALTDYRDGRITKEDFNIALVHARDGIDQFLNGEQHRGEEEPEKSNAAT